MTIHQFSYIVFYSCLYRGGGLGRLGWVDFILVVRATDEGPRDLLCRREGPPSPSKKALPELPEDRGMKEKNRDCHIGNPARYLYTTTPLNVLNKSKCTFFPSDTF